jgi:hypothetical protein
MTVAQNIQVTSFLKEILNGDSRNVAADSEGSVVFYGDI